MDGSVTVCIQSTVVFDEGGPGLLQINVFLLYVIADEVTATSMSALGAGRIIQ